MNVTEQITFEKIRLVELQLTNPNLSETLVSKLEKEMFFLTGQLIKREVKFTEESQHGLVKHGLFQKNNNSPKSVWDTKTAKYI